MCLHYRKNPWKEFHPSMQYKYQTIVVPFLYGPILPQRSHFIVGLWWATGPTLPQYWPNFTPNYGVMMSRWIFSVLFELIIVNWNPFQRWFSEVALVSWHINFISRCYGWGVRARFVIFGCSLPHLTIWKNDTRNFYLVISKVTTKKVNFRFYKQCSQATTRLICERAIFA